MENNGLVALMTPHSAPCWAVPWQEWGIEQTGKCYPRYGQLEEVLWLMGCSSYEIFVWFALCCVLICFCFYQSILPKFFRVISLELGNPMIAQYQWSNSEGYGKIDHMKFTENHDETIIKPSTRNWAYIMGCIVNGLMCTTGNILLYIWVLSNL